MELFLEFSLTLFLSFLFSFLVSMILSVSSTTSKSSDDDYLGGAFNGDKVKRTRTKKFRASKPEKIVGIISHSEFVAEDELCRFNCIDGGTDDVSVVVAVTNEEEIISSTIPKFAQTVMGEAKSRGDEDFDEIEMLDSGRAECEIVEVSECRDDVVEVGWVNACEVFDEWEGVEISELEQLFGAAVAYVGSAPAANFHGLHMIYGLQLHELKLQLYGLHKIAIDGPCHASRPMALKVSARAKWNSWQQLGDMDRDKAMEQYINLVSIHIPEWREILLQRKAGLLKRPLGAAIVLVQEERDKQVLADVETNTNFDPLRIFGIQVISIRGSAGVLLHISKLMFQQQVRAYVYMIIWKVQ